MSLKKQNQTKNQIWEKGSYKGGVENYNGYFSCGCGENIWLKNFTGRVYFGSWLEGSEGLVSGAWGNCLNCISNQKAESTECWGSACFLLLTHSRTPDRGRKLSKYRVTQSRNHVADTLKGFSPSDSRSCQDDNSSHRKGQQRRKHF